MLKPQGERQNEENTQEVREDLGRRKSKRTKTKEELSSTQEEDEKRKVDEDTQKTITSTHTATVFYDASPSGLLSLSLMSLFVLSSCSNE